MKMASLTMAPITYNFLACRSKAVLFWKGISGLKFPCFLFYAC